MNQEDKIVELLSEIRNNQLEDREQRLKIHEQFIRRQKKAMAVVGLLVLASIAFMAWIIFSH